MSPLIFLTILMWFDKLFPPTAPVCTQNQQIEDCTSDFREMVTSTNCHEAVFDVTIEETIDRLIVKKYLEP